MAYLAGAMIALWLMVTVYVFYISLRQRNLERELLALEESESRNSAS